MSVPGIFTEPDESDTEFMEDASSDWEEANEEFLSDLELVIDDINNINGQSLISG